VKRVLLQMYLISTMVSDTDTGACMIRECKWTQRVGSVSHQRPSANTLLIDAGKLML
jgi:hypothetical protein